MNENWIFCKKVPNFYLSKNIFFLLNSKVGTGFALYISITVKNGKKERLVFIYEVQF